MADAPVRMPERPFCAAHYRALIPEHHPSGVLWQTRYVVAVEALFRAAIEDARVAARCRLPGDLPGAPARSEMLAAVLAQCVPLCCFLGPAARDQVREAIIAAVTRIQEVSGA